MTFSDRIECNLRTQTYTHTRLGEWGSEIRRLIKTAFPPTDFLCVCVRVLIISFHKSVGCRWIFHCATLLQWAFNFLFGKHLLEQYFCTLFWVSC